MACTLGRMCIVQRTQASPPKVSPRDWKRGEEGGRAEGAEEGSRDREGIGNGKGERSGQKGKREEGEARRVGLAQRNMGVCGEDTSCVGLLE